MDDPRFGLRRSFNQFPPPMTSQMNPPMYRSFDGGALNAGVVRPLTYMRASSGDFPNARFSPGDAQVRFVCSWPRLHVALTACGETALTLSRGAWVVRGGRGCGGKRVGRRGR
eukprot:3870094-Rhodomonas_salina.1